ncbi:MAG: hypothetical protein ABI624_01085 [Casimicrobiaceae bacterium]
MTRDNLTYPSPVARFPTMIQQRPPKPPLTLERMLGLAILLGLLGLAELAWRLAARGWEGVNRLGTALVEWLHPDLSVAPEAIPIANDYTHAIWLLAALVVACALLGLVKLTTRSDLWIPSPWVAFLPVVAAAVTVLAYVLTLEDGPTPKQRTRSAEQEQATGTGAASYDRVLDLVSNCHAAIRKRFVGKTELTIDGGLDPTRSYIYTYMLHDMRFVRVTAAQRDVSAESIGAPIRALMPPIEGGYQVEGLVNYSPGDDPAASNRDYREYHCAMVVKGERYVVRDLRVNPIR